MSKWDPKNRSYFRKIIIQNLIATAFISLLPPMVTELSEVFSVSIAEIGFINAVFLLISGFISFIWALFADKTERKKLLIICSLIWTICSFFTIFTTSYHMLLILQIIAAIGFGGILPISFTLIVDLTIPEKRAYALGILQMCITLGVGLGLLLGGILINFFPWWIPFLVIAILGFINIGFLFSIEEPKRGSLDEIFTNNDNLLGEFSFKIKKEDLKEITKIKSNYLLVLFQLVKAISVGAINFYFIAMLVVDHQISSSFATILMVAIFSIMIIGSPLLGKFADDQYQKRKTGKVDVMIMLLILGPIFYIIGFSLVFKSTEISLLVIFILLILIGAFFMSGDFPISQSIISDINPPQIRSTVFSILYIASYLGQSIGVLLLGYYYGYFGNSFIIGFVLISFILMLSVIFLIPLRITIISDLKHLEITYKKYEKVIN
ncbi:MAG: MFS transporter [Promethearchaeota archaeon]